MREPGLSYRSLRTVPEGRKWALCFGSRVTICFTPEMCAGTQQTGFACHILPKVIPFLEIGTFETFLRLRDVQHMLQKSYR
jgi:hypothetical protein